MQDALERSRVLQRYADSRNGLLADAIRHMPQSHYDLIYGDHDQPQPPPLVSFAELEVPLPGWSLAEARADAGRWVVVLEKKVRAEGDLSVWGSETVQVHHVAESLDLAFIDARAKAAVIDLKATPEEKSNGED